MPQKKPGPKPTGKGKMPASAFTAPPEYHVFLALMTAESNTSAGVRATVDKLVEVDTAAAETMDLARRAVERARERLGGKATHREVLAYIRS